MNKTVAVRQRVSLRHPFRGALCPQQTSPQEKRYPYSRYIPAPVRSVCQTSEALVCRRSAPRDQSSTTQILVPALRDWLSRNPPAAAFYTDVLIYDYSWNCTSSGCLLWFGNSVRRPDTGCRPYGLYQVLLLAWRPSIDPSSCQSSPHCFWFWHLLVRRMMLPFALNGIERIQSCQEGLGVSLALG